MPNSTGRFHLYSETSKFAMGGALYQIQNGKHMQIRDYQFYSTYTTYYMKSIIIQGKQKKYLVQTRSSRIKLPEVHGVRIWILTSNQKNKTLDP